MTTFAIWTVLKPLKIFISLVSIEGLCILISVVLVLQFLGSLYIK